MIPFHLPAVPHAADAGGSPDINYLSILPAFSYLTICYHVFMKKILVFLAIFLSSYLPAQALEEGRVVQVNDDSLVVNLESGEQVDAYYYYPEGYDIPTYQINDLVIVDKNSAQVDGPEYIVSDYSRTRPLLILFIIFLITTLLITRVWGLKSFIGMLFSFYLIFKMLLPQLIAGQDPILVAIITSIFIIPATFYLSHGINKKTNAAILGTIISLVVTGVLSSIFSSLAHLTGLASEEMGFLLSVMGESLDTRGLVLAGIIIGTLGVLDDVTISQAAIVTELKEADSKLTIRELFGRAMRVGHDHITSMINTLVLVYAGASLPLLLLFMDSSKSLSTILNNEIIAEEIVRTLVSSIGLVLAVPLTTYIAAIFAKQSSHR